jgi:hypothetical protein
MLRVIRRTTDARVQLRSPEARASDRLHYSKSKSTRQRAALPGALPSVFGASYFVSQRSCTTARRARRPLRSSPCRSERVPRLLFGSHHRESRCRSEWNRRPDLGQVERALVHGGGSRHRCEQGEQLPDLVVEGLMRYGRAGSADRQPKRFFQSHVCDRLFTPTAALRRRDAGQQPRDNVPTAFCGTRP